MVGLSRLIALGFSKVNELCFMSNLSSSEWAAWVQALGSIAAIIFAVFIAIYQIRTQHKKDLFLQKNERLNEKYETAKAIKTLAYNSEKAMDHLHSQLSSKESIFKVAEGYESSFIGELERIDKYIIDIPLFTLQGSMVTLTMTLSSTVRQFKEKVENVLRVHRSMEDTEFEDFFKILEEMKNSMTNTCRDISKEVNDLETEIQPESS